METKSLSKTVLFLRGAKGLSVSAVLFVLLLGCNLLQVLSLIVRPFSIKTFRKINRELADFWWSSACVSLQYFQCVRIHFSGDAIPQKENAILVANHNCMADIPVLLNLGKRGKRLGDMKWMAKDVLKYVPGMGWGMAFLDCIFVKRNWFKDQAYIKKSFAKFYDNKIPIWLTTFPEGTRATPEKLEKSRVFARKRGLPETTYVLSPRTKGFVASVQGLRGYVESVYDVTIGFPEESPGLLELVMGQIPNIYLHVKCYDIKSLPREESEISDWLYRAFSEKDRLLKKFHEQGSFE